MITDWDGKINALSDLGFFETLMTWGGFCPLSNSLNTAAKFLKKKRKNTLKHSLQLAVFKIVDQLF
jgi:hypothetical protein